MNDGMKWEQEADSQPWPRPMPSGNKPMPGAHRVNEVRITERFQELRLERQMAAEKERADRAEASRDKWMRELQLCQGQLAQAQAQVRMLERQLGVRAR